MKRGRVAFKLAYSGLALLVLLSAGSIEAAECPGDVRGQGKIADSQGGFTGLLDPSDWFGTAATQLGDLDGNGVADLAVGAPGDDDGGFDRGAVWVLLMQADGTVASQQKISGTDGGFTGVLGNSDYFGASVSWLGDLGACAPTPRALAVGAYQDDDGGADRGAVWILFLDEDGTVADHQKISSTSGGLTNKPQNGAWFSYSIAAIGDQNGDGIEDLAVGAIFDSSGGAAWLLFLDCDGTVGDERKIAESVGGFGGNLDGFDWFGAAVSTLGDIDGDGIDDLAVGAPGDDDGGFDRGALWILFMGENQLVRGFQKISDTAGGFTGIIGNSDYFAAHGTGLGDLDEDGVGDVTVATRTHDEGGSDCGAVWILFLRPDGTVKSHRKINHLNGGFAGPLDPGDQFGRGVARLGDHNGDGVQDLAVGALYDDEGGTNKGALWLLHLDAALSLDWADDSLTWGPPAGATNYDVVVGTLEPLRVNRTFDDAVQNCLEDNLLDTSVVHTESPDPGQALWFLVRRVYAGINGTYDTCQPWQNGPRDASIQTSPQACP